MLTDDCVSVFLEDEDDSESEDEDDDDGLDAESGYDSEEEAELAREFQEMLRVAAKGGLNVDDDYENVPGPAAGAKGKAAAPTSKNPFIRFMKQLGGTPTQATAFCPKYSGSPSSCQDVSSRLTRH